MLSFRFAFLFISPVGKVGQTFPSLCTCAWVFIEFSTPTGILLRVEVMLLVIILGQSYKPGLVQANQDFGHSISYKTKI